MEGRLEKYEWATGPAVWTRACDMRARRRRSCEKNTVKPCWGAAQADLKARARTRERTNNQDRERNQESEKGREEEKKKKKKKSNDKTAKMKKQEDRQEKQKEKQEHQTRTTLIRKIVCPENADPGDTLHIAENGQMFMVIVPSNVVPGQTFLTTLRL